MIDTAAFNRSMDSIRQAARGRWMEILPAITGIPAASLDGRHHPCPKCGGKDRFRMIDPDRGAVLCNQCFNSGNGDGFAAVGWMNGSSFPEVVQAVGSVIGCVLDSATVNAPAIPSQTTAIGPPELRNSVYLAVLANCPLDLQHSTNLTRRGLNAETVRRLEYATLRKSGRTVLAGKLFREFGPDVMRVPGFHTGTNNRSGERYLSFSGSAGMLIPVRDVEGRIVALKVRADEDRPGGALLVGVEQIERRTWPRCSGSRTARHSTKRPRVSRDGGRTQSRHCVPPVGSSHIVDARCKHPIRGGRRAQ
jgi:hypothetical protein